MASPVETCEEIPKEESIEVDTNENQPLMDDLLVTLSFIPLFTRKKHKTYFQK